VRDAVIHGLDAQDDAPGPVTTAPGGRQTPASISCTERSLGQHVHDAGAVPNIGRTWFS
jgi:hypothetical protein